MKTEDEIRQFMKDIPSLVRNMSYEELVAACNQYFARLPILPLRFTNKLYELGQREFGGQNVIYRGRPNENNKAHQSVSDISYMPPNLVDKIKSFGRANKKSEAMFYGAIGYPTACFETLSKGKDFQDLGSAMVTVGIWRIIQPLNAVQLPISKNYWNKLNDLTDFQLVKYSNDKIDQDNEDLRKLIRNDIDYEVLQFFGDAFANFNIESEHDYYLANYYKDRIFNKIPGFRVPEEYDAILYASVPNAFESDNIVILPEAVDSKLEFIEGMQVWVVHHKDSSEGVQFIPIEQRAYPDKQGIFKWNRGETVPLRPIDPPSIGLFPQ